MRNFGDDPELKKLLQSQQDFIIGELNSAVEDLDEGQKVILDSLNYILEQSTTHKQDVERDLKETREDTDQLYTALQQFAANTDENMNNTINRFRRNIDTLKYALFGSVALNLIILGVLLIKV